MYSGLVPPWDFREFRTGETKAVRGLETLRETRKLGCMGGVAAWGHTTSHRGG